MILKHHRILMVCVVISLLLLILSTSELANAETLGPWTSTTGSPTTISAESCAISSGYIYCVGGALGNGPTNAVYYAAVSSSGVGPWTPTTSYPTTIWIESCAISSGYIYCVGGGTGGVSEGSNAVYYAAVSSSGVGTWTSTTSYFPNIEAQSCAIFSGYIYCVGGFSSN